MSWRCCGPTRLATSDCPCLQWRSGAGPRRETPMFEFDKSSKWLLQHHGDSILRLGGINEIVAWRPLPAEVVQPRQLPDGLLEMQLAGAAEPDLAVIEVATYPDERIHEQLLRDLILVYADRRVLPEVLILILHPNGNLRVAGSHQLQSRRGWAQLRAGWRVVELWTVPAEQLLAAQDPGLVPWVPLTSFAGPPDRKSRRLNYSHV